MTTQTRPKLDRAAFGKVRRIAPNLPAARRAGEGWPARRRLPEEVAFKLTNWCDLRCAHCFRLEPARLEALRADLTRIDSSVAADRWCAKLRYNPALAPGEVAEFLAGGDRPAQGKTQCVVHRTRMDVFPGGDVVSCKFFPEFTVGNLAHAGVAEVWRGEPFDRVRETVAHCGLIPVCAKCNLLYTRGGSDVTEPEVAEPNVVVSIVVPCHNSAPGCPGRWRA